ncbi:MAG: AarF/UbiB family protein [Myxococcota bacterium]
MRIAAVGTPTPTPSAATARPAWSDRTWARRAGLAQAWWFARAVVGAGSAWLRARLRRDPEPLAAALVPVAHACGQLKGPFAKLGQFAALRPDRFPESSIGALRRLRDAVPPLPFSQIRGVVEAEWSEPLEARFEAFDPTPMGAASVAQVHRARLHGGDPVIVKVQYPWLERGLDADLAWLRFGFRRLLQRGEHAKALFDEFAGHVRQELDFRAEAAVAAEIATNLASDPSIVVPEVIASHSGRRVLTVRAVPAVGLQDETGLARLGADRETLVTILTRAYAKQVFVDGLFHADPHPGNLFVVDEPGAREAPRLLFVDFGLSRRLDDALKRELRSGMLALLQRDTDGFVDGMERIGAIEAGARPGVASAVQGMFDRIAAGGGALGMRGQAVLALKDEAVGLLRETPGLRLPTELLLYARTLSMVFGLGRELAPRVDPLPLCLPSLLAFLTRKD